MLTHLESAKVWLNLPVQTAQEHSFSTHIHPASCLGMEILYLPLCFVEHKLRDWWYTPRIHYCTICQEAQEGGQVSDRFVWCSCAVLPWHSAPGGFTSSAGQYACV